MIEWTDTPVDVRTLCGQPLAFPILAKFPLAVDASKPILNGEEEVQGREERSSNPSVSVYLLYSVRDCNKVSGTSLRWDDTEKTLTSNGGDYVLPLNYPGWFRILSGDGHPQSLIVPLTSIEQVVASKSSKFLVHSCVTGLWPDDQPSMTTTSKRDSFVSVQVPAGEVLTCGSIFVEPLDNSLKTLSCCLCPSLGKKTGEGLRGEKMYLQCSGTTTGIDVLLPLETYGQFSRIGTTKRNPDEAPNPIPNLPPTVYRLKDLVNRRDFPQEVQLISGTPPPPEIKSKQGFTGLVSLGQTFSQRSIVACQITRENQLAFVEFPDDSGVEFLLASSWEEDPSALRAVDFCQRFSDAYELEIQPIIESVRLHEIAVGKDSADMFRSIDERILLRESLDAEMATDPTSRQRHTAERPQNEATVPTIPTRATKLPTGFKRRQVISHTPQITTAADTPTPRPRFARNSSASSGCPGAKSLDNTPRTDIIVEDCTEVGNSIEIVQDGAVPLPRPPEKERWGSVGNQAMARFTNSLGRHQQLLMNRVTAMVHAPHQSRDLPRSKSEYADGLNIRRSSSGRMTARKLPPLPPSQAEARIKTAVEESNGEPFQGLSSEVESNASDPERLYERIPCQMEFTSNEPSPSAPSSPAPTIRHRQETTVTISPLAYDQDGYLTPVSLRDTGPDPAKGRERIKGNCKKKLGQNFYSSNYQRYIASQIDRIPSNRRYDSERLQSFLDDSVAELHRKELYEKTNDNNRERYYQRNNSADNVSRKRPRSLSARELPDPDFPRDEIDLNLETILDCEDTELDKDEDYSLRFLHRISSTSLRMRRLNPSQHGFDSAALSDSGIASRQSTMRNDNRVYWKDIDMSWIPPEDLSSLTVEEVAMSLRYIGMKDQVAVSFSNEQVDGKLLCEMNSHLLKEGFPNMNSLERKKVLDFVNGWRPKRLLFI